MGLWRSTSTKVVSRVCQQSSLASLLGIPCQVPHTLNDTQRTLVAKLKQAQSFPVGAQGSVLACLDPYISIYCGLTVGTSGNLTDLAHLSF